MASHSQPSHSEPKMAHKLMVWGRVQKATLGIGLWTVFATSVFGAPDEATLRDGWVLWKGGDEASARALLEEARQRDPADARLLSALASVLALADDDGVADPETAVELAGECLNLRPDSIEARAALGEAYYRLERHDLAVRALASTLEHGGLTDHLIKRLDLFASAQRADLDTQDLNDRILMARSLYVSGRCREELGAWEEALDLFKRSWEVVPNVVDVGSGILRLRRRLVSDEDSTELFKSVPIQGDVALEYGLWCLRHGKNEEAERALRSYLTVRSGDPLGRFGLAQALEAQDKFDAALVEVDWVAEALRRHKFVQEEEGLSPSAIALFRARVLQRQGDIDEAAHAYGNCLMRWASPDAEAALRDLPTRARDRAMRQSGGREFLWPDMVVFEPGPIAGRSDESFILGDMDRDGRVDLLLRDSGLVFGESRGQVASPRPSSIPQDARGLTWVDFVESGSWGLMAMKGNGLSYWRYARRGFANKATEVYASKEGSELRGFAVADVDFDGALDAIVRVATRDPMIDGLRVLRGGEAPHFSGESLHLFRSLRGTGLRLSDVDNDGFLEVLVPGTLGSGSLFEISRDRTWKRSRRLVEREVPSFAEPLVPPCRDLLPFDLDQDGDIDALELGGPSREEGHLGIYRNQGPREFDFVEETVFVDGALWDRLEAASLGDVDNNGHVDIAGIDEVGRVRLLVQLEGGEFRDVTWLAGLDGLGARQIELADLDADGDLDLILDGGRLFKSGGNRNRWVQIELEPRTEGALIGARLTLLSEGRSQTREVGLFGGAPGSAKVSFGVGFGRGRIRLAIHWASGRDQFVRTLKPNRVHVVREPRGR